MHMVKPLITTFSKTDYLQRKVNVALGTIVKGALQNSPQFKDNPAIFALTVQVLLC